MSYRKSIRGQYVRIPQRKTVKMWVRTTQSLHEGRGIPHGTPSYKNVYGKPLVNPEPLKDFPLDETTALVTAGFYLFGPHWPKVYGELEVPDKRGKPRRLPNNMAKGLERMKRMKE